MKLRRWDVLVIAGVAAVSAAVFAALGPRAARADGVDPAERIRKALEGAQKVELAGCRLSACPGEVRYVAGTEQQIVLRATNPAASSVALSLTVVATSMEFAMSRRAMPINSAPTRAVECPLALALESGQTVETRVPFKLPAGTYMISVVNKGAAVAKLGMLCSLQVDGVTAARPADGKSQVAAAKPAL